MAKSCKCVGTVTGLDCQGLMEFNKGAKMEVIMNAAAVSRTKSTMAVKVASKPRMPAPPK